MLSRANAVTEAQQTKAAKAADVKEIDSSARERETDEVFERPQVSWSIGNLSFSAPADSGRPDSHVRGDPPDARPSGKLAIGAMDDPLEREADRVADQVGSRPLPPNSRTPHAGWSSARSMGASPLVQRKCACGGSCDQCKAEEADGQGLLQRKPSGLNLAGGISRPMGKPSAPVSVHEVIRTPGQPLRQEVRSFFEPWFKQDLSQVRQHADLAASRSAREVGARAYTVGNHIVSGDRELSTKTPEERRLLAHELTHVMQQRKGGLVLQRQPAGKGSDDAARAAAREEALAVSQVSDEALEKQADEEIRMHLDMKRRRDRKYAQAHALKDKAAIEKKKDLPQKLQHEIRVKLAFFEGQAKAAYLQVLSGAVSQYPEEAANILAEKEPVDEQTSGGQAGQASGRSGPQSCPGGAQPHNGKCLNDENLEALQMQCDIAKKEFVLQYEGDPKNTRCINLQDPEFKNIFDSNITSAVGFSVPGTTWENVTYSSFKVMLVRYRNGTSEYFLLNEAGNFHYGDTALGTLEFRYYKRKDTGLLYPVRNNSLVLNQITAPNLLAYKNGLKNQVVQLQQLYELAQLTGTFAQLVAANASLGAETFKGAIEAFSVNQTPIRGGGGPRPRKSPASAEKETTEWPQDELAQRRAMIKAKAEQSKIAAQANIANRANQRRQIMASGGESIEVEDTVEVGTVEKSTSAVPGGSSVSGGGTGGGGGPAAPAPPVPPNRPNREPNPKWVSPRSSDVQPETPEYNIGINKNNIDLRGKGVTFDKAIGQAFDKTGVPRSQFRETAWVKSLDGKTVPVEWTGPDGAQVNVDVPHTMPAPDIPHIGWQAPDGSSGHIFIDSTPYGRPPLNIPPAKYPTPPSRK